MYENAIATELDHYYGIYDAATETWTYYNRMETVWENGMQYAVLSEPIASLPTFSQTPTQTQLSIPTKDGAQITEFYGLVMGNILTKKRSDGTVFYHKEGSSNGFLKVADDKYVRARMTVNPKSGAIYILCTGLNKATLDYNEVKYLDPLGKYLTVTADASSIKISKAILTAIPETMRDSFTLTLGRNNGDYFSYAVTLSYAQLEAWFELTEIKDCNSGNFNDFVEYDKIYVREELNVKH